MPGVSPFSNDQDAAARLRQGAARGLPVEEFGPVWTSARFRLARASWQAGGLAPFLTAAVPYAATSSGRLSEDAVAVVLAARPKAARGLRVLELGSGTGLFARLFLSALKARAPDVHAATRYVLTDGSDSVLAAQRASGILAGHEAQTESRVLDLDAVRAGDWPDLGTFDAIFGTYILDVLPFDLLTLRDGRVWRREMRGVLEDAAEAEVPALSAALLAGDDAALQPFVHLGPQIALQMRHAEVDPATLPRPRDIPTATHGRTLPFLHNFGALDCIDQCIRHLVPGGVMVFSDYGHAIPQGEGDRPEFEGYGLSIAIGLNFPQIDAVLAARADVRAWGPETETGGLLSRVIQTHPTADLRDLVEDRYGALRDHARNVPADAAREAAARGQVERARDLYAALLAEHPFDWLLLREVAQVALFQMEDAGAALDLADRGLALNPIEAELARLRAEALLALDRLSEAAEAAARAVTLAPARPFAQMTAARVALATGDAVAALRAVAEGLAADADGAARGDLLVVQAQAVDALAAARAQDLRRRANAFRALDAGPKV